MIEMRFRGEGRGLIVSEQTLLFMNIFFNESIRVSVFVIGFKIPITII